MLPGHARRPDLLRLLHRAVVGITVTGRAEGGGYANRTDSSYFLRHQGRRLERGSRGGVAAGLSPRHDRSIGLNLELGTVVECDDEGCRVQLVESRNVITAAFSQKVKDAIRIRQQQLVAVNTATEPAEIRWRWFIGEVESTDGETASVRRLDLPAGSCEVVLNRDGVKVAPGDLVYYGHGESWGIVSRVLDGVPADRSGMAKRYLPEVAAFLQNLS